MPKFFSLTILSGKYKTGYFPQNIWRENDIVCLDWRQVEMV